MLYDGVCGFCNRMNQFVLERDAAGLFDFASLQSPTGQGMLTKFGKDAGDLNTFYVVKDYQSGDPSVLDKSSAALFVVRTIGGPWRMLGAFAVLPTVILNVGYDLVARIRYRLFGRYDRCPLPAHEHRRRFIDV